MGRVECDERGLLQQFTAMFDAPAYIRRARDVERAYEELIDRCARQRVLWLAGVRLHLNRLFNRSNLDDLANLGGELMERIAIVIRESGWQTGNAATATQRRGKKADLRGLRGSIGRFNRRWSSYLEQMDFNEINRLRDGYNRYYLLEKECAVGSVRLASTTFHRLEPVSVEEMRIRFPLLPMP